MTSLRLIDTHTHLDQPEFDEDRQEVIARAIEAGVSAMLAVGISAETSQAAIDLAAQHEAIYAAVGIQPNYCAQAAEGDWDRVVSLIDSPKVVAIGETGLDRYWDYSPFELQQDYFDRHLRLSEQRDLPFIVHTRDCDEDVLVMLREARQRGPLSGVMHSFAGSQETAAECLELGLYISFAGMVTFKKSDELRAVAASIPLGRLLVETDSPYLSPHPKRGKRNEPANVTLTARVLAEAQGASDHDAFYCRLSENAERLFGFGRIE